ncbi:MAG: hypothetical protein ACLFUI_00055 [Halanaerobiales bacterium]
MVFYLLGSFILIIVVDIRELIKLRDLKGYFAYAAVFLTALTLSLLMVFDRVPRSPSKIIEDIVRGFFK